MKKIVLLASALLLLVAVAPVDEIRAEPMDPKFRGRPYPDCPENAGRVVTLSCLPGASAGVAGVYGGTGFGLVCIDGDRVTTTICTHAGDFSWAVSGAADLRDGKAVRFAPSGTDRVVHYMVGRGDVRLLIH